MKQMVYHVHGAEPLHKGQRIAPGVIKIQGHVDTTADLVDISDEMYYDAAIIFDALIAHLPQGTIDRLTCRLLERSASNLVVRLDDIGRKG